MTKGFLKMILAFSLVLIAGFSFADDSSAVAAKTQDPNEVRTSSQEAGLSASPGCGGYGVAVYCPTCPNHTRCQDSRFSYTNPQTAAGKSTPIKTQDGGQ